MINTAPILLTVAAILGMQAAAVIATKVNDCDGKPNPDATWVNVDDCEVPPCLLRKGNNAVVTLRFTPDHDISELTTHASATLFWGIRKGYPGVDGTSACDKTYLAADDSPAPCPLKKGVEYLYKNELYVSKWYPSISTNVEWALQENGNDVTCFQVDAELSS